MISEFRSKKLMNNDFWTKKLPNSGMTHLNGLELFRWKKVIPYVFTVNRY